MSSDDRLQGDFRKSTANLSVEIHVWINYLNRRHFQQFSRIHALYKIHFLSTVTTPTPTLKKQHTPKTQPQKTRTTKPTNEPFHPFHLGSPYASVPGRRRYSRLRLKMPMGARDPIPCHRGHRWGIRILVIHGPSKVAHFKAWVDCCSLKRGCKYTYVYICIHMYTCSYICVMAMLWVFPSNPRVLERCPFCHQQPCSLHHLLLEFPEMTRFRSDLQCDFTLQRIFAVDQCLSTWASQIKFIGLTISLLVDTLRQ